MPEDSRELLARFQEGDAAAAGAIFERYTNRLLALARSRMSSKLARRIDADDIIQSTYRSFFAHATEGEFAAASDGGLWRLLATITLHKLSRQSQRHRAAKRSMDREFMGQWEAADPLANLADREPSPADVVATVEELHWLMLQFESIQRRAIELRLQGLTTEEIAVAVGRSERTIRRWLAEASELLAVRWAQQERQDDVNKDGADSPLRKPSAISTNVAAPLRHSDYHLDALIGSGGMSKVYVATQKDTRRRVAIKVLRKRLHSRPHLVERFLREAEIVARFDHPSIVRIHGLGRLPDGNYFMVMDFIDGSDLASILRLGSLSALRASEIVAIVADTIQHAHEHGVIHRDLKPGNVLLDRDGRVFVTDFGFAWSDGELDHDNQAIIGTAGFMAPEQIDKKLGPIGPHTDVYGLGALIYMLCCGKSPNAGNTISEILERNTIQDSDTLQSETLLTMPGKLGPICRRCLEPEWHRRFSSAADVAIVLREWKDSIRPR